MQVDEAGNSNVFAEFRAHVHGIFVGETSILVTLWDYKKEPQHGYVERLDLDGKVTQRFEQKSNGALLYITPKYVIENNGDVWVTDTDSSTQEVVVVNREGRYRFSYDGREHSDIQLGGIAADKGSNVAIAYYDYVKHRNSIHIVDKDGVFLRSLQTSVFNIECPLALAFDAEDSLWVGEMGIGTVHILGKQCLAVNETSHALK